MKQIFISIQMGTDNVSLSCVDLALLSTYFAEGLLLNVLRIFFHVSEFSSNMQYNENMKEVVKKSE